MRTVVVAAVIGIIMGVGVYIGIAGLATRYAFIPGGSYAGQYACTPNSPTVAAGQTIQFTAAVPVNTPYYWSAPGGTSSFAFSGPLSVRYARSGEQIVRLFYLEGTRWLLSTCSVQVQ